ncbi:hypothetical protein BKG82_12945 [Mycobacteroides chelonae]|uniref:FtsK domain-containing protein n=1 Tax=Mycobacteroides chelonae TaxID=1774 RepID=A0A1S1LQU0_MYCCH|nr:FtsK/SpoIIIE domain-containing protein [Mycobacteroides chelonae]OHU57091.1 hypothetical protein BKG82_12945 [Mycobacteroides chelonae]
MDRTALWPQVIFDEIGVEDPDSWYKDPALGWHTAQGVQLTVPIGTVCQIADADSGTDESSTSTVNLTDTPELVRLSLAENGGHGWLAGPAGSGKNTLTHALLAGLAVLNSPQLLNFAIIADDWHAAGYRELEKLPHCVGVTATYRWPRHVAALAALIDAEVDRRSALVATLIPQSRNHTGLPDLVLVIDQASTLLDHDETGALHDVLLRVVRADPALGLHLVADDHHPGDRLGDIMAHMAWGAHFHTHRAAEAMANAKSTVPTRLAKPGVALLWQASGSSDTVFRGFDPYGYGSATASLPLAQVLDAVVASGPHPGRDAGFAAALAVAAGER